jgi:hypothetical protein
LQNATNNPKIQAPMAESQFLTYCKFTDKSEATELSELLENNNIEVLLEETSTNFDPVFGNAEFNKEYRIKLKNTDFERADKVQIELSVNQIEAIDKDYYLFAFTDQELIELIAKSDEWGKFDYVLAQKILKDRGKEINNELVGTLKNQRLEELAKPEKRPKAWIVAGYVFAVLGGFIALFIGWDLLSYKKTLPNGDRIYGYSAEDRKHGRNILICGVFFLVLWVIMRILNGFD